MDTSTWWPLHAHTRTFRRDAVVPSLQHPVAHPHVRASQFVGNGGTNELWINDGSGVFSAASGDIVSGSTHTRAVAWADVDRDGDVDLVAAACPHAH